MENVWYNPLIPVLMRISYQLQPLKFWLTDEALYTASGQGLFFDPEEYANVAPVEDKLDSETQETSEPTKKKPTLRILD